MIDLHRTVREWNQESGWLPMPTTRAHHMGHSFQPDQACGGCPVTWRQHQLRPRPCPDPRRAVDATVEEAAERRREGNRRRNDRRRSRKKKHAQNVARNRHAVAEGEG